MSDTPTPSAEFDTVLLERPRNRPVNCRKCRPRPTMAKPYDSASRTTGSFERAFRNAVETQPYTAVAIALGLGWLFGRMHRPF